MIGHRFHSDDFSSERNDTRERCVSELLFEKNVWECTPLSYLHKSGRLAVKQLGCPVQLRSVCVVLLEERLQSVEILFQDFELHLAENKRK